MITYCAMRLLWKVCWRRQATQNVFAVKRVPELCISKAYRLRGRLPYIILVEFGAPLVCSNMTCLGIKGMNSVCDGAPRTNKQVWSSDKRGEVLWNSSGSGLALVHTFSMGCNPDRRPTMKRRVVSPHLYVPAQLSFSCTRTESVKE